MAKLTKEQREQIQNLFMEGKSEKEIWEIVHESRGMSLAHYRKKALIALDNQQDAEEQNESEDLRNGQPESGNDEAVEENESVVQEPAEAPESVPPLSATISLGERSEAKIVAGKNSSEWLIECCGYLFHTFKETRGRAQRICSEYQRGTIDDLQPAEDYSHTVIIPDLGEPSTSSFVPEEDASPAVFPDGYETIDKLTSAEESDHRSGLRESPSDDPAQEVVPTEEETTEQACSDDSRDSEESQEPAAEDIPKSRMGRHSLGKVLYSIQGDLKRAGFRLETFKVDARTFSREEITITASRRRS